MVLSRPARQAKELRSRVFRQMLESRGWKYRAFLRYLGLFKYLTFDFTRGEFLESYYTLMRYLDDVVDGDITLPAGYTSESEYMLKKIEFAGNPVNPTDEAEWLMKYCLELAGKFEEDVLPETIDILESLLFDARRRRKMILFPEKELNRHFHLLDIRGTIRATLKVFKDDPDKYRILEPLGTACRHQYDIEDFDSDIRAGFVNISLEDMDHFGIKREELTQSSSGVRSWLRHHATKGMTLLEEHRILMPEGNFSILQKSVFKMVYEFPARKVFLKFLSGNE